MSVSLCILRHPLLSPAAGNVVGVVAWCVGPKLWIPQGDETVRRELLHNLIECTPQVIFWRSDRSINEPTNQQLQAAQAQKISNHARIDQE